MEITPDEELLAAGDTVWPVYIDPSVTASLADWTTISDAGWKHYRYTGDDGLGYCNQPALGCSSIFRSRMMWEYGGLAQIGALARADVVSATFRAYGTHSYSCSAYPVSAWRVGGFTANTGWPGVWYGSILDTQVVAHKSACGNQRWIEWDVTEALRQIADENRNAVAIGLRDPSEISMAGWKRYRNDARLSVTYNRAPNRPSGMYLTTTSAGASEGCGTSASPTYLSSLIPYAWATISDPDGGNVRALFDVYRMGSLVWNGGQTAAQASGQKHNRRVPSGNVIEGLVYEWRVFAYDGARQSASSRSCFFVGDVTNPVAPTVTPVTGTGLVTYPEDGVGGLPGQQGRFRFGSGASTDVVKYLYSFDSSTPTTQVLGANPTVNYTPSSAGPHYLTVKAVDRVDRVGPAKTYRFWVGNAATSGRWALDDGSGSTAADAIPGHPPLTLSVSTTWGDGARAEVLGLPDGALVFDGAGDVATSPGPVAATNGTYSVMAFVRLDDISGARTAVSQDGVTASGFELGYRTSGCPTGMTGCWAFTVNTVDGSSPAPVVVASSVPVRTGWWVQLTGVRDTSTGVSKLYVCEIGDGVDTGDGLPVASSGTTQALTWNAAGSLRVGQGRAAGAAANPWSGAISGVQVWEGLIDGDEAMRVQAACQNVEIPALLPQP